MTTDTIGGVWTYSIDLIKALEPFGMEVLLTTMGGQLRRDQRLELSELRNVQVAESAFKLEWMDDPWVDVYDAGDWLLKLESKDQFDVVHLSGFVHGKWPFRAPKLIVGHSCVSSWWSAVKGRATPASWDRYRQEVTEGLNAADVVVTPTRAMLEALHCEYRFATASTLIYNGRDPGMYTIGNKEPMILSAGRLWDDAKNISALAAIAPKLPWRVVVAGEQSNQGADSAVIVGVEALGRLDPPELAQWLSRAWIYALPARYEPFGLSVLEAALSGCALILGDIPSLREVWGDAALYVEPDDRDGLISAILLLIDSRDLREKLSERALQRADLYSPSRMAAAYAALYGDLIKQHQSVAVQAPSH